MKTVDTIYQELLAAFAERAGWTPEDSCDLSVRLYAAAAQLQALFVQADWVLDQSFPQTAQGDYLDYHALSRGLSRTAAVNAAGTIRFSTTSAPAADLTVPAGTVCLTAGGARFQTTADAVLSAGSLGADAPAKALETGAAGNVSAGTIVLLAACPAGITGCTNPTAFSGGCDAENDESLRTRILESYQRLPNGANAAYYETVAMSHTGVAAAKAVGRARGIGTVNVYVAAPAGLPSGALLAEVQEDLQARREIAVDVQTLAPSTSAVNVSVELTAADGVTFAEASSAAETAVRALFTGKLLGKPVLRAALEQQIYSLEGVANCHLLSPAADTEASASVLPVLGTLLITQIGGN